jgi:hypothetical protein
MKFGKLSLANENVRLLLIIGGIAVVFYFLHRYYNSKEDEEYIDVDREGFENDMNVTSAPGQMDEDGEYDTQEPPQQNNMNQNNMNQNNMVNNEMQNQYDVNPAEAWGMNERPRNVNYLSQDGVAPGQVPNECYPKDTLKSVDLLPGDANSVWAQVNPMGQGALGDQNLLNSGHHIGINTVGQTLRNANMQLRSEPANPQVPVSPWLQSTIEPDLNRRPLEIGSGN